MPRLHLLLLLLCLISLNISAQDTAAAHHQRGLAYHDSRALNDASREYARALTLDPPRELSADEWQLVRRFAPRLYTTPTEVFPLKDFAAIVHPTERLIAYHFFWEDDIDFPEDNDPCDHELIWVRYSADKRTLENIWTYFHGNILAGGEAALRDARQHAMRPRVNVQWGKHGSLLHGWETMTTAADEDVPAPKGQPVTLRQYNEATFRKLSTEGRRLPDHPIALRQNWPQKFTGTWNDFVNYSRLLDPLTMLNKTKLARVTRWNSATINQQFLAYNFRPKTEWPLANLKAEISNFKLTTTSLDAFQLPPKTVFDKTMPRYPNAWFYVDTVLADSYTAAVKLVTDNLRTTMQLRESYGPFDNAEGCDFEVTLEHLQPWIVREHRALQHSHAFHMRYYFSALAQSKLEIVKLATSNGERPYYRFGASVHYEVEHTNPNHADVEICPICGRTGEYAALKGNLVELAHDPLGLELVMTGKIRGAVVRFEDQAQRPVGSVDGLREKFVVQQFLFPAQSGDRNTLRIGVVVINDK